MAGLLRRGTVDECRLLYEVGEFPYPRKLFPVVIEILRRWSVGKETLWHKIIARLGEGKQLIRPRASRLQVRRSGV